jgi:hypothetical protein
MKERGVTMDEVIATVHFGKQFPADLGRTGFRRNFRFDGEWLGKHYATKKVEVYAVQEKGDWTVITVIAKYF